MKRTVLTLTFLSFVLLFNSCKSDKDFKSTISGKTGEVVIVISKGDWEAETGTSLRNVLAVDYPYLNQREPMFTLINIPQSAFTKIFQLHRNIIVVTIDPSLEEDKLVVQQNVWAKPQTVVTLSGKTDADLAKVIDNNSETLAMIFEQAERNRVIENSKKYDNPTLRELVISSFGGSPYFPQEYSLKKQSNDFIWISYEPTYRNQGIFVYSYPFDPADPITLESVIRHRNEILKAEVPGMFDNSYMTTSTHIEPSFKWMNYRGRDYAEVRGFWEVQNDFMGGPFVCHAFMDRENKNVIVLEAFIYAPRDNKRNYLRQSESIIYSFEWREVAKQ